MYSTYYADDNLHCQIEWQQGVPFVHLTVMHWNKSVAKTLVKEMGKLEDHLFKQGHPYLYTYNKRPDKLWYKFMDFVGYKFLTTHEGVPIYFVRL